MLVKKSEVSSHKQHPNEHLEPFSCECMKASLGPATIALAKEEHRNRKHQQDIVLSVQDNSQDNVKRRKLCSSCQSLTSIFNFDDAFRALQQDDNDGQHQNQVFPTISWCFDDEK